MKKTIFIGLPVLLIIVLVTVGINYFNAESESPKKLSGAYKALKFWNKSRAYPYKDIPSEKYFRAFQEKKFPSLKMIRRHGCLWGLIMFRAE